MTVTLDVCLLYEVITVPECNVILTSLDFTIDPKFWQVCMMYAKTRQTE